MINTYWDKTGAEQAKYQELMDAVDNGYELTKQTENAFHSYYRYYNDGDFPGWARGHWDLRKNGIFGWELNEKGLELQEQRITEAVIKEHKRLMKLNKEKYGKDFAI